MVARRYTVLLFVSLLLVLMISRNFALRGAISPWKRSGSVVGVALAGLWDGRVLARAFSISNSGAGVGVNRGNREGSTTGFNR